MKLKKGKFLGAIVLAVFLLSSCKSLKNSNTLFQSEYDKFADTAKSTYIANPASIASTNSIYKIQAHDLVAIKNIQSLNGPNPTEGIVKASVFRVDSDGNITLPAVGVSKIAGLTQSEAGTKVQDLYAKSLLKNPLIELVVMNFKVSVMGDVLKQGNYLLERENVNLIEILAESGGLKPSADPRKIKIIRGDLKNPEVIYANLNDLRTLGSAKLILKNNDIIYIPHKGINNVTEGFSNYLSFIQPVMLILNAVILFTIKTQ